MDNNISTNILIDPSNLINVRVGQQNAVKVLTSGTPGPQGIPGPISGIATYAPNAGIATYATNAGIATYAPNAGIATSVIGGIGSITQLRVTGISTFSNGPVLIGTGTSTGTASQRLQVTGGAYVSGSIGIGTTNPQTKLEINGVIGFSDDNIKIGNVSTGSSVTLGSSGNFFAGSYAGEFTTQAFGNNFLGNSAGYNNITGSDNNFFGYASGYNNTTGSDNNFFGYGAGQQNTTGSGNIFIGFAGGSNATGSNNNFFGSYAGQSNTIGSNNIYFGTNAGNANQTGSENVIIGKDQNAPILNGSNQLVIGAGSTSWITGNSSYNVGIGTTRPTSKLTVVGDVSVSGVVTATTFSGTLSGYATSAGIATYATNAGIATYATNAGIATYAPNAGIATYATSAGIATYATNAGIATYATNAGIATYATSAGIATYATSAGIATYATSAGIATEATRLQYPRTFEISGDIVGAAVTFDGTGNVSIAATIQPNSVALGTDTTGDYVQSITGTANQISVSVTSGEGSTPVISIPTNPSLPGNVTIGNDLNVTGNITIGGTTAILNATTLQIKDKDIILGITTNASNQDVSTDITANHGGIAIASTEGSPLFDIDVGFGTDNIPSTYKQIMWLKSGAFAGLNTDAWLTNYAFGVGTAQMPSGSRFAAGNFVVGQDDITAVRNINSTGIITATTFSGTLSGYATSAGIATYATSSGIATYADNAGIATYATSAGIATYATSSGIATYADNAGTSTSVIGGIASVTQLNVSGISTFSNGPVLIGAATSTGTASQPLQVTDGAYVSGNFGIGNTNPQFKLDVGGDINFTGTFYQNGTQFVASRWTSGSGDNIYRLNGNVGIGTTNPQTKLEIGGVLGFTGGNTKIGNVSTGSSITTGSNNNFIGVGAGQSTTTGSDNIFIGQNAGNNNQTGSENIIIGKDKQTPILNGSNQLVIGSGSRAWIYGNSSSNVGIGVTNPSSKLTVAGQFQSTANNNDITGGGQIYLNGGTGNRIDFAGVGTAAPRAKNSILGRSEGTKIVLSPGVSASHVDYAVGIETSALWYSVPSSGQQFKWYAGITTVATLFGTGEFVLGTGTSTGTASQRLQVTGGAYVSDSIGIGNTNPQTKVEINGVLGFTGGNIKIGNVSTGSSITTGNQNNFFGSNAGKFTTEGSSNNFFGPSVGQNNTTGSYNNILGYQAGSYNTTGSNNNFFGSYAGAANTTGSYNNFLGIYVGGSNATGSNNNFFGSYAGQSNTIGSNNIYFGTNAGNANQTGSENVIIGKDQNAPILNGSNQLVIGAGSTSWITGNSSYNVTVSAGNLVIGTSGKGIDFSATANSSGTMTSELLDDYETGTWTPTVSSTGSGPTVTYTEQLGKYTKIGNIVYCSLSLRFNVTVGGGGLITVSLPYTSATSSGFDQCTSVGFYFTMPIPTTGIAVPSNVSTAQLLINENTRDGAGNTGGRDFAVNFFYVAA